MTTNRIAGAVLVIGLLVSLAVNVMALRGNFGTDVQDALKMFWRL